MGPIHLCAAGDAAKALGWMDPWPNSQGDTACASWGVTYRVPYPLADLVSLGKTLSFEVSREVSPGALAVWGT